MLRERWQKRATLLFCLLFLLAAFPAAAHADSLPPPPSPLDIAFRGLEGETYYVGLLGPAPGEDERADALSLHAALASQAAAGDRTVLEKFEAYKDADGFTALNTVQDCSATHRYHLDRFPSYRFKVLLYFPSTGHFIVSDRIYTERTLKSSSELDAASIGLRAESSGAMDFGIQVTPSFWPGFVQYLQRLTLTLAIELGVAWLFRLRGKRVLGFIAIVNVVTQTLLTLATEVVEYQSALLMQMLLLDLALETAVFLTEAILYAIFLKRFSETPIPAWKPWVYAWAANTASLLIGVVLFLTTI